MFRNIPIALAGFLLLLATGCSYDVSPDQSLDPSTRGATDQQIHDGTCEDACGEQSGDGCWCDDQCESFGDCCSDYQDICVAVPVDCPFEILCAPDTMPVDTDDDGCFDSCEPVESECFDDSMCAVGEQCVATTGGQCCPPNAACDLSLPPCNGQCVPEDECQTDADCENGICEHFATCAALDCPPPPPSVCSTPNCDDGTVPVCLIASMPVCGDSEVLAVRDGCFTCVNAYTCEAPPPPPVSCVAGSDCGEGMHCEFNDGDCGGVGTCVEDYDVCYEIFAPTCGCDGETYGNDCFARAASGGVAHMGECEPTPPPPPGACDSDADCAEGELCTQVQCVTTPCPPLCMPAPEPTCAGSCGGQSDDGCWCDSQCADFGDCCGDINEVCGG